MKLSYLLGSVLTVFITSCNSVQEVKEQKDKTGAAVDTVLENKIQDVYYSSLLPSEAISYFEKEGFNFRKELLNPLSNTDKYTDPIAKLLNIGIYSADVAYQILCKKTSEATQTFKVIKNLCNDENIEFAFDENTKKRILDNISNFDSLNVISNDVYNTTMSNVRESGAQNNYIIISSGSFVETMYLIISSVKSDAQDYKTVEKIIEQKLLFDDLYSMLQLLNTDENVSSVLTDISELKKTFSDLTVQSKNVKIKKTKDGNLVLSGNNKITYSKESFKSLKLSIIKLRTKWTAK